ncbi:hypothetical protein [Halorubellus litoreus]|uniref:HEAT repeat-containing protein n=1 Tax=Halorubellus litoreus TaxID=755308 RepID=A0ABD5VLD0_9EURY
MTRRSPNTAGTDVPEIVDELETAFPHNPGPSTVLHGRTVCERALQYARENPDSHHLPATVADQLQRLLTRPAPDSAAAVFGVSDVLADSRRLLAATLAAFDIDTLVVRLDTSEKHVVLDALETTMVETAATSVVDHALTVLDGFALREPAFVIDRIDIHTTADSVAEHVIDDLRGPGPARSTVQSTPAAIRFLALVALHQPRAVATCSSVVAVLQLAAEPFDELRGYGANGRDAEILWGAIGLAAVSRATDFEAEVSMSVIFETLGRFVSTGTSFDRAEAAETLGLLFTLFSDADTESHVVEGLCGDVRARPAYPWKRAAEVLGNLIATGALSRTGVDLDALAARVRTASIGHQELLPILGRATGYLDSDDTFDVVDELAASLRDESRPSDRLPLANPESVLGYISAYGDPYDERETVRGLARHIADAFEEPTFWPEKAQAALGVVVAAADTYSPPQSVRRVMDSVAPETARIESEVAKRLGLLVAFSFKVDDVSLSAGLAEIVQASDTPGCRRAATALGTLSAFDDSIRDSAAGRLADHVRTGGPSANERASQALGFVVANGGDSVQAVRRLRAAARESRVKQLSLGDVEWDLEAVNDDVASELCGWIVLVDDTAYSSAELAGLRAVTDGEGGLKTRPAARIAGELERVTHRSKRREALDTLTERLANEPSTRTKPEAAALAFVAGHGAPQFLEGASRRIWNAVRSPDSPVERPRRLYGATGYAIALAHGDSDTITAQLAKTPEVLGIVTAYSDWGADDPLIEHAKSRVRTRRKRTYAEELGALRARAFRHSDSRDRLRFEDSLHEEGGSKAGFELLESALRAGAIEPNRALDLLLRSNPDEDRPLVENALDGIERTQEAVIDLVSTLSGVQPLPEPIADQLVRHVDRVSSVESKLRVVSLLAETDSPASSR